MNRSMDFSVFSLGTRHTTLGTRDSDEWQGMSTGKDQTKEWGFLKNREWTAVIPCEKEFKQNTS